VSADHVDRRIGMVNGTSVRGTVSFEDRNAKVSRTAWVGTNPNLGVTHSYS
jgi:hypothetical protein